MLRVQVDTAIADVEARERSADGRAAQLVDATPEPNELLLIHAYWRAANSLSVGQVYLYDNPMRPEPLTLAHAKPRVVKHWETTA